MKRKKVRHCLTFSLTCKTIFNVSDLQLKELPVLVVLAMLLGTAGTGKHSGKEIQMLVKERIGNLAIYSNILPGSDHNHCKVQLVSSVTCLAEQADISAELLIEILRETRFIDRALLRDMLQRSAMEAQLSLPENGHQYAVGRVSACGTAHGAAREWTSGVELALWLKRISTAEDACLDELLSALEKLASRIFSAERLTVSCSDNVPGALVDSLIAAFPEAGHFPVEEAAYTPAEIKQEGLIIPAAVGFAAKGTTLKRHGKEYHGSFPVLSNVLNFVYLWSEIRVQGGAYGCGFTCRDDGDMSYYTYRDPQPGRSLAVMNRAADFVRRFCADDPDLTGFILGAVSALDPLMTVAEKMTAAENRYFKGIAYEDICLYYHQLIHTTPEDLLALCGALEDIEADNAVCVIAGKDQLDECGDMLTSRYPLSR